MPGGRLSVPELRKDYVTDTWVVFSHWRSQKPTDLNKQPPASSDPTKCPFCPGRESLTPPEIMAYRNNGGRDLPGWWVRCVPNKFPALTIEGEVNRQIHQIFHKVNGVGAHEVIIESPDHFAGTAQMEEKQIYEVICAYRDRYRDLTNDRRFKYILIFKNWGASAGASMAHPHSQLIATPVIPRYIMEELTSAQRYYQLTGGTCIYDEIIQSELEAGERLVMENDRFVAFCPYASRFPFETWILPKQHSQRFEDMDDPERWDLASALKDVMGRLHALLNDPPYNYYIHTAPCDRADHRYFHWHIEITPSLTTQAGFERGTGFYINPVPPEDAAKLLRGGVEGPGEGVAVGADQKGRVAR
jgi:UDPglucose--hexose-1-phosphate uridylyltransferase